MVMNNTSWIDLVEYAQKYGVSQSTLRRRIRTGTMPHRLEKGKYLLPDSPEAISSRPLYARIENKTPVQQSAKNLALERTLRNRIQSLEVENRNLKTKLAELETLVQALDAESREAALK